MTSSQLFHPLQVLTLAQLRQRQSAKWQRYDADILPLWVAEMDVPLAQPVIDAVVHAMEIGDTGYGSGDGYGEAFAEFALARWSWHVDPVDTFAVMDVLTGITEVIAQISGPDVPVVITPPVYGPFEKYVGRMGRKLLRAVLTPEGRLNPETLEATFAGIKKAGTGGIVLISNPHNPTGVSHTRAELEMLAALASKYGIRIISDEIHAPLQMPGHVFIPMLSIPGAESAIVVTSASKSFNLAGLKAALVVGGPESRADLTALREGHVHGASHLGNIAHAAAYRHGGPWLDAVLGDLNTNRHLLAELIAEHLPGAHYFMPESTYLAWLDCRPLNLGGDPAEIFQKKGKVVFSPGSFFGDEGAGHVRINFATSPSILTEALRRAGSVLR
ncbi:MAG: aminotransferase class I/II-fold pyridoxal phosphate-dependent enzyme [Actinomycetales bacterium]|nr:aminotransferase class I/II-fold pyridoxal phosphate-dependent enzyme [Actinomycetales bacterium]